MDNYPQFFNPFEEIRKWHNRLPHWEQSGGTYFITFNMVDSIPQRRLKRWKEERDTWLKLNPEPWEPWQESEYHERFSGAIERWLDAGHGSCFLRKPQASRLVASALSFFDHDRYLHHSWVVMPNHVHAVLTLNPDRVVEDVLHSWKSFTSHEITKAFPSAPNPFWQRDYFDRLVRDASHFRNVIRYIRRNPTKARLKDGEYLLYESELARSIL